MNSKKFYELLGIAYLAKKITWGELSCSQQIKSKSAFLIIISNDIGDSTKKKIERFAFEFNVQLIMFGSKFELAHCIGKKIVSVIAVTDFKFADKLKKISEV